MISTHYKLLLMKYKAVVQV